MEYLGLAVFATVVLAVLVYPTKPKPQIQKPEVEFAVFEDWVPLTSHDKAYVSLRVSDR